MLILVLYALIREKIIIVIFVLGGVLVVSPLHTNRLWTWPSRSNGHVLHDYQSIYDRTAQNQIEVDGWWPAQLQEHVARENQVIFPKI